MRDVRERESLVDGLARLLAVGAQAMQNVNWFSVLEFDAAAGRVEHLGTRRTLAEALAFVGEDFQTFARSCEDATGEAPDNLLQQIIFVYGAGKLKRIIRYRKQRGITLPVMSICDANGSELETLKA